MTWVSPTSLAWRSRAFQQRTFELKIGACEFASVYECSRMLVFTIDAHEVFWIQSLATYVTANIGSDRSGSVMTIRRSVREWSNVWIVAKPSVTS